MKLKQKLIIIILLVSGIPLILLSIASNLFFSSELKQTINAANFSKSRDIHTKIDDLITSDLRDIKILAKNPDIRSFNLEKAGQLLTETKVLHSELSLTLSDGKGQQLVKDNKDKLSSVSSRSFFQQAIKGNEDAISEVLISQAINQPIVVLATPVRDKEGGNIVGVLQASMELTKMSDYVKNLSDKNTTVYIVDKEGKVLAHPNSEYVTERKDLSKVQFIQSGLSGKSSSEVITDDSGKKVLVSYNYYDKTGWLICTETLYSLVVAKANTLSIILFAATAVILIIIGFVTYFLSDSITKPIVRLSAAASQIAKGDLNISAVNIRTKDEIGNLANAFSIMSHNLRDIVRKIKDTSNSLLTGSEDLTNSTMENTRALSDVVSTINEMAQGNSSQSEMISDTSNTIEEISHGISDVSIATEVGANQSIESLKLVEEGQNSIKYQVERMNESDITTKEISAAIGELNNMAQEISGFVVAINSIAEQTNLLALNASIEAARAGENGKGFAVVAGEIRNLSESSAKSVNEIRGIIEKISVKTIIATEKAENVVQAMQAQKNALNITQTTFNKIKQSAGSIANQSQNIAATLNEIKEKTKAVVVKAQEMASITEQSSASMQEVSASSEEQLASLEQITEFTKSFSNVAKSLIAEVDIFKL